MAALGQTADVIHVTQRQVYLATDDGGRATHWRPGGPPSAVCFESCQGASDMKRSAPRSSAQSPLGNSLGDAWVNWNRL